MTTYLIYIKELFLVAFLSFVIGIIILKATNFTGIKIYTKFFFAFLIGVLSLTILQALTSTSFNTILLSVPILLGLGYYFDKKLISSNTIAVDYGCQQFRLSTKILFFVEISILIIFLYSLQFFILFKNGDSFSVRLASQDLSFYARCADYIRTTGIEVCNNDYLFSASSKPYHFGDLWLNSVISNVGGNNTIISLILTFKIIYQVVFYLGLMAVVENVKPLNYKIKLLCALAIFFTPLYFSIYENVRIFSDMTIFSQTLYQAQKLFFIQALLLAAIVLNALKRKKIAVASLLCIPVLYTVTIIPVYAGFILYIIYIYTRYKKLALDEMAIAGISSIYILLYYFIINSSGGDLNSYEMNLVEMVNLEHTVNIIGGTILKHFILYFPVIILIFLNNLSLLKNTLLIVDLNPIYVFIFSMPIFGLLLWSITSGDSNAVQLFQNIAMPILYTGAILIILASFITLLPQYRLLIFTLLVLNAVFQIKSLMELPPSHNSKFLKKVMLEDLMANNIYVTYKTPTWYSSIFSFGDKGINLGNYLAYSMNKTQPVSLDIVDIPIVGDRNYVKMARKSVSVSTFYRYIESRKKIGIYRTNIEYQLDFIKEHKIRMLITLKSVKLPDHLNDLVVNRFDDDVSDEVVCILADSSNYPQL